MIFRDDRRLVVKGQARQHLFRRRKQTRPGELVRAALDTFVEKGFAATRLDDVSARAGVSKGTIYLYFDSKEALFKAVVKAGMAPAMATIEVLAALAATIDRPAIERLHSYCGVWQRIMRETPTASLLKLLLAESSNFPEVVHWFDDSVVRPAKMAMANIVAAGVASGDFRPIATEIATDMFFALVWQCVFAKVWCGPPSPEQFLEQAFEVLARGIVTGCHEIVCAAQRS